MENCTFKKEVVYRGKTYYVECFVKQMGLTHFGCQSPTVELKINVSLGGWSGNPGYRNYGLIHYGGENYVDHVTNFIRKIADKDIHASEVERFEHWNGIIEV